MSDFSSSVQIALQTLLNVTGYIFCFIHNNSMNIFSLQVFVHVLTTSCDYSQYKFVCKTQTTKKTDGIVLSESISAVGPPVTGCGSKFITKLYHEKLT